MTSSLFLSLSHTHTHALTHSDFPAYATQHELVTISFKVSNKTIYVQEFEAHLVINNDSFTCSGNKLVGVALVL